MLKQMKNKWHYNYLVDLMKKGRVVFELPS